MSELTKAKDDLPDIDGAEELLAVGWTLFYPKCDGYSLGLAKEDKKRKCKATILLPPKMVKNENLRDWLPEFEDIFEHRPGDDEFQPSMSGVTRYHYEGAEN